MKIPPCVIIGGGGHARVVLDILFLSKLGQPQAIIDSDKSRHGSKLCDVPIVGGDEALDNLKDIHHFVMGIAGAGNNAPRMRLYKMALEKGLKPLTIIHPGAIVSPQAVIADGVQIFPGAIINAGATIGENVIVNSRAIVEHDVIVNAHAHIAPGACVCGAVQVGEGAHVGAASVIRQGIKIGARAIVGIGAVVLNDIAEDTTVIGNPARTN